MESVRHRKPKPKSSHLCEILQNHSHRERDQISAAKGGPRECAELGNVEKGYKAAAVRQTPLTWQRADTPSAGPGIHARHGSAGGHGDGRALPLQAGLYTQKGRRCFCPRACRDVTGSSSTPPAIHQHGPCNGEVQQVLAYQHGISVRYAALAQLLPGCARSPALLEGRDHQDFLPYSSGRSLWWGIREGFGAREERGPQARVPAQASAWSLLGALGEVQVLTLLPDSLHTLPTS